MRHGLTGVDFLADLIKPKSNSSAFSLEHLPSQAANVDVKHGDAKHGNANRVGQRARFRAS